MDDLLLVGIITSAHGIKGEVKIRSFTEPKTNLYNFEIQDKNRQKIVLTDKRAALDILICKVAGVNDRDAAQKLKGTELFIVKSTLPEVDEGEVYIHEMIGREVFNTQHEPIGTVEGVHDFNAGPIIEILFTGGTKELHPFNSAIFPDNEQGLLVFVPPIQI